jgi:PleD family two-component response regulator
MNTYGRRQAPKFAQKYNTKRPAGLRKWVVHPDMPASKCNIAIVEDDASLRRALERLLRASGFEAHTFASAENSSGALCPSRTRA